jgi:hypothetical protein
VPVVCQIGQRTGANSGQYYSFATIAYRALTRATVWVRRYSQASRSAAATSIAVGPHGSRVYVSGTSHGRHGVQHFTAVAYGAQGGTTLWVTHYTDRYGGEAATSMALSKDGSELGHHRGRHHRSADLHLCDRRLPRRQRRVAVVRHYGGASSRPFGLAESVAITPNGSRVVVTGYVNTVPPTGSTSATGTVAYNAATGATLWAGTSTGPVSGDSQGLSVAASPNGSAVFVTGGSPGSHNDIDMTTIAYRP